jgi:hypothetical protein
MNSGRRRFGIRSEPNSVFVAENNSPVPSETMPITNADLEHHISCSSSSSSSETSNHSKEYGLSKCVVSVKQLPKVSEWFSIPVIHKDHELLAT